MVPGYDFIPGASLLQMRESIVHQGIICEKLEVYVLQKITMGLRTPLQTTILTIFLLITLSGIYANTRGILV